MEKTKTKIKTIVKKLSNKNIYAILYKSKQLLVVNENFNGSNNIIYFHK